MAPSIGPYKTREAARKDLKSGRFIHKELDFQRMGFTKVTYVKKETGWFIVFIDPRHKKIGIFGA